MYLYQWKIQYIGKFYQVIKFSRLDLETQEEMLKGSLMILNYREIYMHNPREHK